MLIINEIILESKEAVGKNNNLFIHHKLAFFKLKNGL